MKAFLKIALPVFVLFACNTNKQSNPHKSSLLTVSTIAMVVPSSFIKSHAPGQMRIAEYRLKSATEYSINVFHFGMQDMIDENISRWRQQFVEETSYTPLTVKDTSVIAVKILGTYKLKDTPMAQEFTETENYGTLAAIVPSYSGPLYFKLSAPGDILGAHEDDFLKMLNSYEMLN